jgi:hypothetical protein
MPDEDDPFADLGQTLNDDPETPDETPTADDETGTSASDTPSDQRDDQDEASSADDDPLTDPAFSYETASQRPFYARPETIDDFDAWLNYELERDLSERGYQNIVVREMTDALLRTVVEEDMIESIADRFEHARDAAVSE